MTICRKMTAEEKEQLGREDMYDCIRLIWKKIRTAFAFRPLPGPFPEAAELAC